MSVASPQLSVSALAQMVGLREPAPARPVEWVAQESPDPEIELLSGHVSVTAQGDTIPCLLLRPRGDGPKPAVVAIHQHNNEYHLGKSEPAGLAGDPHAAYGLALAREGFLVAIPDLMGFEDRGTAYARTGRELELFLALNAVANGGSLHGQHVSDVLAVADYLRTFEEISGNVAVAGHSLGGQLALLVLALAPDITAGAISGGLTTLAACRRADVLHNAGWYLPGLEAAGDYPAIARMIAGKRVLSVSASHDEHFPADGAHEVLDAFAPGTVDSRWRTGTHPMDADTLNLVAIWLADNHD